MTLRTLSSTNPPQGVLRKGEAWGCEGVAGPWRHVPGSREPAAARSCDWSQWWRHCRRPGRWLSWVGPLHVLSPSPGWESKEAFYTQLDQTAGRKSEVRRGLSEPSYTPHATHIKGLTVCAHTHVSSDHLPSLKEEETDTEGSGRGLSAGEQASIPGLDWKASALPPAPASNSSLVSAITRERALPNICFSKAW